MQNHSGDFAKPQTGQGGPQDRPWRLLQITDTHLFADPAACLLGLNTQDSFERVVDMVARQQASADWIVATGDIAQDASPEAYQRFISTVSRLNTPFCWIPGNHDRRSIMTGTAEFDAAFMADVQLGNWKIIMLDTSVPGDVHGVLSDAELARLDSSLSAIAGDDTVAHALVCLHHNPVPGSADWMEEIGLQNADALLEILARHDSVRAVVYGHIHQTLDFTAHDLRFFCTPSTCIQFKPDAGDFALDLKSPGYRWFDLFADGRINSQVERLQDYTVSVDENAGGY